MNCKNIKIILNDYLINSLETNEKIEVENHLKKCKKCNDELSFLIKYNEKLSGFQTIKVPDNFVSKVNEKLDRKKDFNLFPEFSFDFMKISLRKIIFATGFVAIIVILLPFTFILRSTFFENKKLTLITNNEITKNENIAEKKTDSVLEKKEITSKPAITKNNIQSQRKITEYSTKNGESVNKLLDNEKSKILINPAVVTIVFKMLTSSNQKIALSKTEDLKSTESSSKKSLKDNNLNEEEQSLNPLENNKNEEIINIKKYNGILISKNNSIGELVFEIPSINYEELINDLKKTGNILNTIPEIKNIQTEHVQIKIEINE